jgi:hypothetical protein
MNKYMFLASLMLFVLAGSLGYTTLTTPGAQAGKTVYAQEDCAEGETWNEETQKCEAKAD